MSSNFFLQKKVQVKDIFSKFNIKKNFKVRYVKSIHLAKKTDISFFDSIKYKSDALSTKAGICITQKN